MNKRIILLWVMLTVAVSCDRPRNIPDDKLVAITRELFLANAYKSSGFSGTLQSDSIDIYSPIFEKYGYKPTDFAYTIKNLSRRKSIRFTDIIDQASNQIASLDSAFASRVALLDTIAARIDNRYARVVFADSLPRRITRASDPDKPDITIAVQPGRYLIEYVYEIDTADRNSFIQYVHHVEDTAGIKSNYYYRGYLKGSRRRESFDMTLSGDKLKEMQISLATVNTKDNKRPPVLLTVDSLRVTYYMPREQAVDSLLHDEFTYGTILSRIRLKNDSVNVRGMEKNIRPPYLDTAGMAQRGDTVVRR